MNPFLAKKKKKLSNLKYVSRLNSLQSRHVQQPHSSFSVNSFPNPQHHIQENLHTPVPIKCTQFPDFENT